MHVLFRTTTFLEVYIQKTCLPLKKGLTGTGKRIIFHWIPLQTLSKKKLNHVYYSFKN